MGNQHFFWIHPHFICRSEIRRLIRTKKLIKKCMIYIFSIVEKGKKIKKIISSLKRFGNRNRNNSLALTIQTAVSNEITYKSDVITTFYGTIYITTFVISHHKRTSRYQLINNSILSIVMLF